MKHAKLQDMVKGWFVGDFNPTVMQSTACEVAVKHYKAGDHEETHHHRVATEITLIVSGHVCMMGQEWRDGDIIVIEPGEATDFQVLQDTVTVVVKLPSAKDDKFIGVAPGAAVYS
ncbi:MAG: hypothetical protein B7Z75_10965 [Acidocella sp. 20-57-95]|nr:MAG: hypothetical protein B7Z75_10965 [Acidocella sp. 20-57-95]HQT63408.1 hypothetical protein [Acidocella sp.]